MKSWLFFLLLLAWPTLIPAADLPSKGRHTSVSIVADEFYINGKPTYAGRWWNGHKIQGLLLNARLVQGDQYDFDRPENNFTAAVAAYASWGLYDQGTNNYHDGFKSPPVDWKIETPRKERFFRLVNRIAGGATR